MATFKREDKSSVYPKSTLFPDLILATPGHDNVGISHGGGNEPVVGGLDVVLVLLQHPVDVSAPVGDVALEPPRQPHVRVRVDKHLLESTNVNGVKTTCCLFTIVNNISSAQTRLSLTFMSSMWRMASLWKARMPSNMITLAPYIETVLDSRLCVTKL